MFYRYICLISLFIVLHSHCSQPDANVYKSPEGYNLNKPVQIKLPVELDEISGITFYAKDTSVFAIDDEFGWLYKIPLTPHKPIAKWKFAGAGDYEDLALVDKVFYVLKSNGDITSFTFNERNEIVRAETPFPAKGNDFEILYYDPHLFKLVMICKDCKEDNKHASGIFYYNLLNKKFDDSASINVKAIEGLIGEKKLEFKPSAAAINPATNELYILSSANRLLVIVDRKGHPRQSFAIDPGIFKQPEGIAFTPNGDMIISNEAAKQGVANILFFKYHKKPGT